MNFGTSVNNSFKIFFVVRNSLPSEEIHPPTFFHSYLKFIDLKEEGGINIILLLNIATYNSDSWGTIEFENIRSRFNAPVTKLFFDLYYFIPLCNTHISLKLDFTVEDW